MLEWNQKILPISNQSVQSVYNENVVGHLTKGNNVCFSKTIFFFSKSWGVWTMQSQNKKKQSHQPRRRYDDRKHFRIYWTETIYWYFNGKHKRLTYILLFYHILPSARVARGKYAHGTRNKVRAKKNSS